MEAEALSQLATSLTLSEDGGGDAEKLENICKALASDDCDKEKAVKECLDAGILPQLQKLLNTKSSNQEKAAQVIAELAKVEYARLPCVEAEVIPPLVQLMGSSDIPVVTQACRGLGNICFDNDRGRSVVDEHQGVQKLLDLLKAKLGCTGPEMDKLRMVACGFLLNLSNTHESIQEKSISLGAMELMDEYLRQHGQDEGTCQFTLMSIGSLSDSEAGREKLGTCKIAVTIGNLLTTETGSELQDTILELLGHLSESDEVKVQLAESSVKDHLISMLKENQDAKDEDSLNVVKLTSDLIILILTGDQSMETFYQGGEGAIFKETVSWLRSDSEQLKMSGALAIGNFARNDDHCLHLVDIGITKELLALLQQNTEVSPTLQHAVFSALRNLAIPAKNKPRMIESGVLDTVLQYLNADMSSVQFKMLGLLRMLVDKQENAATKLGTNKAFMNKLVEWCHVQDHAGVKGEANRLVASLVKNSRTSDVMHSVVSQGGVKPLVDMVNAEHAVMQNEALVALTLIASTILESASQSFVDAELVPTLKVLLTDKDTLPEITSNVLSLMKLLGSSGQLMELMKIAELPQIVKGFKKHESKSVQSQAKEVTSMFDKG